MAKKDTYSGYPDVFPNPKNQDPPEQGEVVKVLQSGTNSSLVRDSEGNTRVVQNENLRFGR